MSFSILTEILLLLMNTFQSLRFLFISVSPLHFLEMHCMKASQELDGLDSYEQQVCQQVFNMKYLQKKYWLHCQ